MSIVTEHDRLDAEVIVVGGGPIGLTTACALAHHGVDCLLVEQRRQPKEYSRANNLWARPQELLAGIGVRDAIAEKSYKITKINTLLNGRAVDPIGIADVPSPYGPVLYSGQDVIETTLSEQVVAKGGRIERGRKVTGFTQDADGVSVRIAAADEEDEEQAVGPAATLRCRYLVGADGAKGFIRNELGFGFEPEKLPNCMNRQVDAKLHWRRSLDRDHLWFFYYPRGFCGVLPVWEGYHRLFFLADDTGIPDRDPTLEEMQAIAREVTEDETLTLTDPIWLTHSRFQHGTAAHYAKDRVFLVGDAGHLSLPAGGQGMNAGFHDAVGVAWRLAMALRGKATPLLLESYDAERGGEHRRLDAQQVRGFQNSVYRGPVKDAIMDVAARFLPNIGALIQGSADLQQLTVAYPASPLNEDHLAGVADALHHRTPKAGDRAPDAALIAADGTSTTLFAHLYNPDGRSWGWSLLGFDGRQADALPDLRRAFAAVAGWGWVRPRLVLGAAVPEPGDAVALSDLDGEAHAAYGIGGDGAVVLVRPDGHIAYRGRMDRPEPLAAYCEKLFGTPAS
ncbi:FAD-dependent oxidoreductase [Azospirillum picis]|uniref:2-polyprenyl-6-methoxyphenol hydroxylase-like FAD-dependent oxidoreductase n=1 Tax=Azospirillum picis TaxID=488438 RepID=A0ABU0MQ66_9PROT|nr:FAD-dependent oxidoreductase [Azospirillum picis]MBP2302087.1 2-polyprenyl-6-methoxyphenol hydroxylase-like FAD-dependent oxidoreductase [Azospirillum picis]MDQ0535622.1 2-polyprenyl-6-methoxyphenol hydroxylase-like FAD-dependent oxidoreductase [Azospirillum picis]